MARPYSSNELLHTKGAANLGGTEHIGTASRIFHALESEHGVDVGDPKDLMTSCGGDLFGWPMKNA